MGRHPYAHHRQLQRCQLLELAIVMGFPDTVLAALAFEEYVLQGPTADEQTGREWALRMCVRKGLERGLTTDDVIAMAEPFYRWAIATVPEGGYPNIYDPPITPDGAGNGRPVDWSAHQARRHEQLA